MPNCNALIKMKNGNLYCEVAHIIPYAEVKNNTVDCMSFPSSSSIIQIRLWRFKRIVMDKLKKLHQVHSIIYCSCGLILFLKNLIGNKFPRKRNRDGIIGRYRI